MNELSPGISGPPFAVEWASVVGPSIDGLAVPFVEGAVSPFALRFFADFESTGTVLAVAMVRGRAETDCLNWGRNPGSSAGRNWSKTV